MAKDRGKIDDTLAAMFSNPDYRSNYLFYAHIIGQCSIKIRYDIEAPAGVAYAIDHYNLYINPDRFDIFSLKERLFILQHEMHHILQKHVARAEDRIHLPWNYACDCAINQLGNKDHFPKEWVDPFTGKKCKAINPETLEEMIGKTVPKNLSSEHYYELLNEEIKKAKEKAKEDKDGNGGPGDGTPGSNNSGNPDFGDGEGDPQPFDDHSIWEESEGDAELQDDVTKKMIEKAQTETFKGRGTVPYACNDWLEMHTRKAEMNWKKILRGIVGNKRVGSRSTIMRNDRRFPKRQDLRGKVKDRTFNLLIVSDVSGSMSDHALLSTLGEVRHICDIAGTEVDLIQVDSQSYKPEKLTKNTKIISRKGHGGTYLYPGIEMAREHGIDFQAVVVTTDGGLSPQDVEEFRKLKMKVIWLIEAGGYIMDEMSDGRMIACQLKDED